MRLYTFLMQMDLKLARQHFAALETIFVNNTLTGGL